MFRTALFTEKSIGRVALLGVILAAAMALGNAAIAIGDTVWPTILVPTWLPFLLLALCCFWLFVGLAAFSWLHWRAGGSTPDGHAA